MTGKQRVYRDVGFPVKLLAAGRDKLGSTTTILHRGPFLHSLPRTSKCSFVVVESSEASRVLRLVCVM